MKDSKNLVIGLLCTVLCVMAVAYAAFSTSLTINGTASIDSTWNVAITDVTCTKTTATGGVTVPDATKIVEGTTATIGVKFNQPGDAMDCVITVTNSGSLDGKLTAVTTTPETIVNTQNTHAIWYYVGQGDDDASVTDVINKNGGTHTYTVRAEYHDIKDANNQSLTLTEEQKSRTLVVNLTYKQNGVSE